MKRWVISLSFLSMAFMGLTGCASNTVKDFSCPAPNTAMCKPVHDVDKMVDAGDVGDTMVAQDHQTTPSKVGQATSADIWGNFSTPYASTIQPGQPLRLRDTVMAVWIAPYEDSASLYHDASTVYAVMVPSRWSTKPVKAVKES